MPTPSSTARLLLGAATLIAITALVAYFGTSRRSSPTSPKIPLNVSADRGAALPTNATPAPSADLLHGSIGPATATTRAATPALVVQPFTLTRTAAGRIAPETLAEFTPQQYPGGPPGYDGEAVTAYVAVPSTSRKVAVTLNQLGEFPRQDTAPSENVEVRLVLPRTAPGERVAIVAQDGGRMHTGQLSTALVVDAERQVAFGFKVSPNVGLHRIAVTTPAGEVQTLEFWAGPPPVLMQAASR